jgi:hypothetical protein
VWLDCLVFSFTDEYCEKLEIRLENTEVDSNNEQQLEILQFGLSCAESESLCLSVTLSLCLSVSLSVSLSLCLSLCLSVTLSLCLSLCLSVTLSLCLSVTLSLCHSVNRLCHSLTQYILATRTLSFEGDGI